MLSNKSIDAFVSGFIKAAKEQPHIAAGVPHYARFIHYDHMTPAQKQQLHTIATSMAKYRAGVVKDRYNKGYEGYLGPSTNFPDDIYDKFTSKHPGANIFQGGGFQDTPKDPNTIINAQTTIATDHTKPLDYIHSQVAKQLKEYQHKNFLSRLFSSKPSDDNYLDRADDKEQKKVNSMASSNTYTVANPDSDKKMIKKLVSALPGKVQNHIY